MIRFENLTKQQLWALRKQVVVNSAFLCDYENTFGFDAGSVATFFDGYYDYLWELAEENGKSTHEEAMKYDSPGILYDWFNCSDDLSWIESNKVA